MSGTLKPVEILVACHYGDVGRRLTPNATLRDWLVSQGYAKVVEAETPERPAKLTARAAAKIGAAVKSLI